MMTHNSLIATLIWSMYLLSVGSADELDFIMALPESERPAHIAAKMEEYAAQFSSSIVSFTATERGSEEIESSRQTDPSAPKTLTLVKGSTVHELVLSASNRYARIQDIEGDTTLITYDGKEGRLYGYDKNRKMTYVDHICNLPSLGSMSLEKFVELTGITTFNSNSNSDLISKIEGISWGERRLDSTLGDCVILQNEVRSSGLKLDRKLMYFGLRDSTLVLLRYESVSQYEYEFPIYGAPAIAKYKWLNDYEYARKSGKLLPQSWTYLITNEYTDLDGRLLPVSKEMILNPNIIRSTTTTISKCKLLDRFPDEIFNIAIDPKAALIDSCQNAVQELVAMEQKPRRWFSYSLLALCLLSGVFAVYFYSRSRRK